MSIWNLFNLVSREELAEVELKAKQDSCKHEYLKIAYIDKYGMHQKRCCSCDKTHSLTEGEYYLHNYTLAKHELNNHRRMARRDNPRIIINDDLSNIKDISIKIKGVSVKGNTALLIDGQVYKFNYHSKAKNYKDCVMTYQSSDNKFHSYKWGLDPEFCTDIVKMVTESVLTFTGSYKT